MISKQLIHCLDLACLKPPLQFPPVRFEHFERCERENLLHKGEHPRAQQEHALAPVLEVRLPVTRGGRSARGMCWRPPWRRLVLNPHGRQGLFDVLEVQ